MSQNPTDNTPDAIVTFQLYYTPLLATTGCLGNFFAIYIFCKTKLGKLSSSYYLTSLAINDNVFLICLLAVWLKMIGIDVFNRPGMCQTIVYLTGISSFLDIWLVVAFTFERYIAVQYPFLRQTLCTTTRAKNMVVIFTAVAFVALSPLLLFSTTVTVDNITVCTVDENWSYMANAFNYVDFIATYILPVAVVVFLNVSICKALIRVSVVRKSLTNGKQRMEKSYSTVRCQFSQNNITKMLLVVSTTFLCLNLPSYVMRLLTYLLQMELIVIDDLETFQTLQQWCLQLFYTSFGINFYLYCISGQNFRKALVAVFREKRKSATEILTLSDSRTASNQSSSVCRRKTLSMKVTIKKQQQNVNQINNPESV